MKISSFGINGFGIFADVLVEGLEPGLNVFVGNNEAGKSTLLAFFRSVLFGFPDGRSRENPYEPLAGGRHGGRIIFEHQKEGAFTLSRYKEIRGEKLLLEFADGRRGGAADLARITHGMDRNAYSNVWAVGLAELATLKNLTGDDVKGALLGAGMGAAVNAVPRARQEARKQMDALFAKKGSRAINQLLQQLDKVNASIDKVFSQSGQYKKLKEESLSLAGRIEAAWQEKDAVQARLFHCDRLLGLWDDWILWGEAVQNLEKLAHLPKDFPMDALSRFGAVNEGLEKVGEQKKENQARLEQNALELAQCRPDSLLLEKEAAISALAQRAKTHEQNLEHIEESKNSIHAKEDSLKEVLASLGPGWTEEMAAKADRSLFAQQQIAACEEALSRARRQADLAGQALKSADADFEKACQERASLEGQIKNLPDKEQSFDEAACEKLMRGQDRFVDLARRIPALESQQAALAAQLEQSARQVSASFGPENLVNLDPSGHAQLQAGQIENELSRTQNAIETAQELLEKAQNQLTAKDKALYEKARLLDEQKALKPLDSQQIEQARSRLNKARPIAAELAAARLGANLPASGPDRPARLAALVWLGVSAVCAGGILALWAALADLGAFALAAGLGLAGAGIAWLVLRQVSRARAQAVRQRIAALENDLAEILGQPGPFDQELMSRLEEELSSAGAKLARIQILEDAHSDACQEAQTCKDDHQLALKRLERAVEQQKKAKDDWQALCAGLGLGPISPQELRLVFRRAEQAGDAANKAREMARQMQEEKAWFGVYLADAQKLGAFEGDLGDIDVRNLSGHKLEALAQALERFLEKVRQAKDAARQQEALARDLKKAAMQEEQAGRVLEKCRQESLKAAAATDEARTAWENWLEKRRLPKGLDFAGARQALLHMEKAARLKNEISSLKAASAARQEAAAAFIKEAKSLFEALGIVPDEAILLSRSVLDLDQRAEQNSKNAVRAQGLVSAMDQLKVQAESLAAQAEELADRKKELFAAAGAQDEEDFRRLAEQKKRQEHWEAERDRALLSMKKLAGAPDLAPFLTALEETAKEALALEIERAKAAIAEIDRQIEHLRNSKAAADAQSKELAKAGNLSALLGEREAVKEEIRLLAQRWAKYAACGFLVDEAAKSFEKEHQPQVFKDAGAYFAAVTKGRYRGVMGLVDENLVEAVSADFKRKPVEALSRGTAEQLYLCLRLAYIKKRLKTGLPVIMDDVLANFDPNRAAAFARVLCDFASENQVLFFTCHPKIARLFAAIAPKTPFFAMDGQGIAPASSWPL
ncbi:MAG: AAA family ATPase [Desulfatibacillaceae bacterium]|nr:AAA family ATPase [Desulfatibacillaceae bacterium]